MSDLGNIYTWGVGNRGQLGHGNNIDQKTPFRVSQITGRAIQIDCGFVHTLALTVGTAVQVFSWGGGDQAQLGHGLKDDVYAPQCIKALLGDNIRAICSGMYHCAAINQNCSVYTWGGGSHGRLGHGDDTDATVPRLLDELDKRGVKQIAMGMYHSLALTDDTVYAWGRGAEGQLGLPPANMDANKEVWCPTPIDSMEGMDVQTIVCGAYHSMALTGFAFPLPETPNTKKSSCTVL